MVYVPTENTRIDPTDFRSLENKKQSKQEIPKPKLRHLINRVKLLEKPLQKTD